MLFPQEGLVVVLSIMIVPVTLVVLLLREIARPVVFHTLLTHTYTTTNSIRNFWRCEMIQLLYQWGEQLS